MHATARAIRSLAAAAALLASAACQGGGAAPPPQPGPAGPTPLRCPLPPRLDNDSAGIGPLGGQVGKRHRLVLPAGAVVGGPKRFTLRELNSEEVAVEILPGGAFNGKRGTLTLSYDRCVGPSAPGTSSLSIIRRLPTGAWQRLPGSFRVDQGRRTVTSESLEGLSVYAVSGN